MTRNLSFDGLRGVAALSVLALHLKDRGLFPFPGQNHAVDLFFVLSGFVIAASYEARLGDLGVKGFMRVRLRKLYPIWAISLTVLPLFALLMWAAFHFTTDLGKILGSVPFQAAFLPSPRDWVADDRSAFILNGPGWSLSLEMAINLLYALTIRRVTTGWVALLVFLAGATIIGLDLRGVDLAGGSDYPTYLVGVVRVFFGFPLGVLLYRLPRPGWHTPVPILCGLLLGSFFLPGAVSMLIVMPLCVWLASTSHAEQPVLLWSGRLSYPLYAIHVPALTWAAWAASRVLHLSGVPQTAFMVLAALLAALAVYHVDEAIQQAIRPARKRKAVAAQPLDPV